MGNVAFLYFLVAFSIYYLAASWLFKNDKINNKVNVVYMLILTSLIFIFSDKDMIISYLPLFISILLIGFEIVIPGFGIFGVSGIIGVILSFALFNVPTNVNSIICVLSVLVALVLFLFIYKDAYYSLKKKEKVIESTRNNIVGKEAIVVSNLRPVGKIQVDGKVIDATSQYDYVEKGETVIIIKETSPVIVKRR